MELYVPKQVGDHYTFTKHDPSAQVGVEFNNIRTCTPVKEFLFPLRELAAVFPERAETNQVEPFAVFGLKECDLRSIEILDKVFREEDFKDPSYVDRREKMFIIAADCFDPGESCFCNAFDAKAYPTAGFDLNVSKVTGGFVIEAGSDKGRQFIEKQSQLFTEVPEAAMAEREQIRARTQQQLEANNAGLGFDASVKQAVLNGEESDVFDIEAKRCILPHVPLFLSLRYDERGLFCEDEDVGQLYEDGVRGSRRGSESEQAHCRTAQTSAYAQVCAFP